jgi:hypothetical protein
MQQGACHLDVLCNILRNCTSHDDMNFSPQHSLATPASVSKGMEKSHCTLRKGQAITWQRKPWQDELAGSSYLLHTWQLPGSPNRSNQNTTNDSS